MDGVVGIGTGYRLDDREVGILVSVGSRIFLLHVVQTGPPSLLSNGYRKLISRG
jgi:hypothetical protein